MSRRGWPHDECGGSEDEDYDDTQAAKEDCSRPMVLQTIPPEIRHSGTRASRALFNEIRRMARCSQRRSNSASGGILAGIKSTKTCGCEVNLSLSMMRGMPACFQSHNGAEKFACGVPFVRRANSDDTFHLVPTSSRPSKVGQIWELRCSLKDPFLLCATRYENMIRRWVTQVGSRRIVEVV